MSWVRLIEERMSIPAHKPHKGNKLFHLIREMWPAYLIEIVVIILGISITLALEQWRDGVKERKLEQVYLGNLLADIQADRQSLRDAASGTQLLLGHGNDLLQFVNEPVTHLLSTDQVHSDVRAVLSRPKFIAHDATFSDLKTSGNLHLVDDISLDRKSTRLNSSHLRTSRMPSSA